MTSFHVGGVRIERVEEVLELGFEPSFLFPGFDPAIFERHPQLARPNHFDKASGRVTSSIQSWLLRVDGKVILVDTCSGNGKARALPIFKRFHMLNFPYLENLAKAGVQPDDVDYVFCTHLHIDHVGWNTRDDGGRWVPTFRNARYIFGRREFEHWQEGGKGRKALPQNTEVILDSVMPVVEAGLVDFVDDGDEILPGFKVEAAPGHTETQLILKYQTGEGGFVCTADAFHQPIQIYEPHLSSCFCEDRAAAERTRRRLLNELADTSAILMPIHFGPPHAGFVRRDGAGFRFEPLRQA